MVLELNDKEWQILTRIVDEYLPELRLEIASGRIEYDWRMDMKKEEELVKGIVDKLHRGAELIKAA